MSNTNSILYFVSQTYRQVQLSVEKGKEPYTYGEYNRQFHELLEASGDEEYTKNMAILLVEETARLKQTTDYLRQEMAFETKSSASGKQSKTGEYRATDSGTNFQVNTPTRRIGRQGN